MPGSSTTSSLRAEPLHDLGEIAPDEWDGLAQRSGNLFATREWVSTWWEQFGTEDSLLSFSLRDSDDQLVALLPMYVRSDPAGRELRFIGHGLADRLGPVCTPGDRSAVAIALRHVLYDHRASFDRFVGDDLPEHEEWGAALGAQVVRRTSSPLLWSDARDWESWLAARSANFRQQVRRRERRLIRECALSYRLVEDPTRLDADFQVLLDLHDARWSGASRSFAGPRAIFHRRFAARALERGWLRLWIAEVGKRPAAAWYGFRFGGVEWYYQAGRDPRYDDFSIGFVLLVHTIRAAIDDRIREYRLLRGDESYKQRFANRDAPLETVTLASDELER